MIKISGVTKSFDGFCALKNLSMTVPKGSVFGLVGPNGAGKTTLIKNILGILKPDSGEILIDGINVCENPQVKEKIFYISDDLEEGLDIVGVFLHRASPPSGNCER